MNRIDTLFEPGAGSYGMGINSEWVFGHHLLKHEVSVRLCAVSRHQLTLRRLIYLNPQPSLSVPSSRHVHLVFLLLFSSYPQYYHVFVLRVCLQDENHNYTLSRLSGRTIRCRRVQRYLCKTLLLVILGGFNTYDMLTLKNHDECFRRSSYLFRPKARFFVLWGSDCILIVYVGLV